MEIIKDKGLGIWGVIMFLFRLYIYQILFLSPVFLLNYMFEPSEQVRYIIETIGFAISYILAIKLSLKSAKVNKLSDLKLKNNLRLSDYILLTFFFISFTVVYDNTIGSWIAQLIERYNLSSEILESLINMMENYPIIGFIQVCIIAPLFEEIIFRGIILEQLSKKYNNFLAIIVSALLFGIIHFNLEQGINAFLVGIVLGLIYVVTRNLWTTIIFHFLNNFISFILIFKPEWAGYVTDSLPILVIELVLGVAIVFFSYKKLKKFPVSKGEYNENI